MNAAPTRPLGALLNPEDPRDQEHGPARFFGSSEEPKAGFSPRKPISYRSLLDKVPNQIGQSCNGHALASGVYLHGQIHGHPAPRCSALGSYTIGRMLEGEGIEPKPPLRDVGSYSRLVVRGARDRGMLAETEWEERADRLNAAIPFGKFQRLMPQRIRSWYPIGWSSEPGAVAETARQLLAAGVPILFNLPVTRAFERLHGDQPVGLEITSDPSLGRHAVLATGYDAEGNLEVLSSWGAEWGDEGFFWLTPEAFEHLDIADRIAITTTPWSHT